MSRTQRAFIAFPIFEPDSKPFKEITGELTAVGLNYNWVPVKNLHLTAAFLGSVTTDELEKINLLLADFRAGVKTLTVELAGLTGFPSAKRTRVTAVKFKGNQLKRLKRYVADLRRLLQEQQVWFDDKHFVPHVTLGRSQQWQNISFYDYLVPEATVDIPPPQLYTSQLHHDGAIYTVVD